MDRILMFDPGLCTGCRLCEIACSFAHEGVYWPAVSRIHLVRFEDISASFPVACAYCDKPPCEEVCPTGAMTHDGRTGYARVIAPRCIGCKECLVACPFGAIDLHVKTRLPQRCDLCGGDPACLKVCTAGAIRYGPPAKTSAGKRRTRAARHEWLEGEATSEGV